MNNEAMCVCFFYMFRFTFYCS